MWHKRMTISSILLQVDHEVNVVTGVPICDSDLTLKFLAGKSGKEVLLKISKSKEKFSNQRNLDYAHNNKDKK